MRDGAAQGWFIAGATVFMLAGSLHALYALYDTVRPRFFTPIEQSAQPAMDATGIRLRRMFRFGDAATPTVWNVWLGMHISHGVGLFTFGLLCVLIANYDFGLVKQIDALQPLTIVFSAAYIALSLRFFFYGPLIITVTATACFVVAAALSS